MCFNLTQSKYVLSGDNFKIVLADIFGTMSEAIKFDRLDSVTIRKTGIGKTFSV